MGAVKPTDSTKRLADIPDRRPMELWVASDSKAHSEIQKGAGTTFEEDLRPTRLKPLSQHDHPQMSGPGFSVPNTTGRRRAGFQRKRIGR